VLYSDLPNTSFFENSSLQGNRAIDRYFFRDDSKHLNPDGQNYFISGLMKAVCNVLE
jgi:hypothetical protein